MATGNTGGHIKGAVIVGPYGKNIVLFIEGKGRRTFHLPADLETKIAEDAFPGITNDK